MRCSPLRLHLRELATSGSPTHPRILLRSRAAQITDVAALLTVDRDVRGPAPATLAPTDVLVRVRAAPVHWVDLLQATGQYQHLPALPYTPGLDSAGVVEAVGSAVPPTSARAGERVMLDVFGEVGPRNSGAYAQWGGLQALVVAPHTSVRRVPDALSFAEAACFSGPYETAYHALHHRAKLRAGETVLILGATGSSGSAAAELAREAGARSVLVGGTPEKLREVERVVGGSSILDSFTYGDEAGWARVRGAADVVFDTVGGEATLRSIRACKFRARVALVGWTSTPHQKDAPNQLPTNLVLIKSLDVLGCPVVIHTKRSPEIRAERAAYLHELAAEGRLRPLVDEFRAVPGDADSLLAAARAAFAAKAARRVAGNAVVVM